MASKFLVPDREQSFLQVTSYRELLGPDELVWTVIEVVEDLDLSEIYARYGDDPSVGGRPAYDPAMMVALLMFGYCEGKRSARELESACRRDVAYQAICGGMVPDHATIARFRAGLDDLMADLFTQVLAACAERGLVRVGTVALDGTRMEAAASKDSNVTAAYLEELKAVIGRILAEADAADAADSAGIDSEVEGETAAGVSDDPDSDELGWSRVRRRAETQRKLERIQQAQGEVEGARQRRADDEKRRSRKRGGKPTANLTDPESRLQKTRAGWVQGYNGQAVVSADQVVIAAELTAETTDTTLFEPMLLRSAQNLTKAGASGSMGVVLADAGYWSHANAGVEERIDATLLIAPGKGHQIGTVSPFDPQRASPAALARHRMETRLAAESNQVLYRQRAWMIEGTFAHTKTHRRSRRFSRRGLAACDAEWKLIHLAGNILKIHRHHTGSTGSAGDPDDPNSSDTPHRQHNHPWTHQRCPHHRRPPKPPTQPPPVKRHFLRGEKQRRLDLRPLRTVDWAGGYESRKPWSSRFLAGIRSLASALVSSWRTRSLVTPK